MCNDQPQGDFRYVDLWERRVQLFWSRLQTAAAIQTGVMVGWYFLIQERKLEHSILAALLCIFGFLLLFQIHKIMKKDGDYIDAITKRAGDAFPSFIGSEGKEGRIAGLNIVKVCIWTLVAMVLLSLVTIYLFWSYRVF